MSHSGVRAVYANVSGLIRLYPRDAATLGDYKAVMSVGWTGKNSVFLFGANGKLGRDDLFEVAKLLANFGVEKVMLERRDCRRMPFARLVEVKDGLSLWAIDSVGEFVKKVARK